MYHVERSSMYFFAKAHALIVLYFSMFSWTTLFSSSVREIIQLSIMLSDFSNFWSSLVA